eukprot:6389657-Pyramimonas_sp.AAC.1
MRDEHDIGLGALVVDLEAVGNHDEVDVVEQLTSDVDGGAVGMVAAQEDRIVDEGGVRQLDLLSGARENQFVLGHSNRCREAQGAHLVAGQCERGGKSKIEYGISQRRTWAAPPPRASN